jgi:hypothetical protein
MDVATKNILHSNHLNRQPNKQIYDSGIGFKYYLNTSLISLTIFVDIFTKFDENAETALLS